MKPHDSSLGGMGGPSSGYRKDIASRKDQLNFSDAKIKEAIATKFADIEPEKWDQLYKMKLKYCFKAANFHADSKKQPE